MIHQLDSNKQTELHQIESDHLYILCVHINNKKRIEMYEIHDATLP